jgi:beta-lactamase class A
MISRRTFLLGSLIVLPTSSRHADAAGQNRPIEEALVSLETKHGGRLGVAILNSANGAQISHRGNELFALCSTFKFLAAAYVLHRVDRKQEDLSRRIVYGKGDLVTYSPITEKHVGDGMTVGALCEATITLSDNTAGNLLLDSFGGPAGLTGYIRTLGDQVTRLDRREPELNVVPSGEVRDTTSPLAMLGLMHKLLIGGALSAASTQQLAKWLIDNKTGDKRLRAGIPKEGWQVGDKTGTGPAGETNDIGIIWPPSREPILVTAYYTESKASPDDRNTVLAEVGRLAAMTA